MATTQRLLISGRVHGVGYRNWTIGAARDLKLRGWVRNVNGGAVEIVATGEEDALDALAEACQRGPRLAQVDRVDVQPAEDVGWKGFTKRFGT